MKKRLEKPNLYLVTVERERVITERRTVQVVAYTPDSAKQIAKQKRPSEGWQSLAINKNQNSKSTTSFGPSWVDFLGVVNEIPDDPIERHALLNDSMYVVKVQGEF